MAARRARYVLALAATVALGIASRRVTTGVLLLDKSAGDVLYAVAAFLALGVAFPGRSLLGRAIAAFGLCAALEVFQATGIPARHADRAIVRWLIGTTFAWHDLACYAVGVALVAVLEARLVRGPEVRG